MISGEVLVRTRMPVWDWMKSHLLSLDLSFEALGLGHEGGPDRGTLRDRQERRQILSVEAELFDGNV